MKKLVLIGIVALLAGCARDPDGPRSNHSAHDHSKIDHGSMNHAKIESSTGATEQPYDLQFIDTMIVHHYGAVEMANLVKTRSRSPELNKLAETIIADQSREIAKMNGWRDELFAGKPAAINMELAGMRDSMSGMDSKRLEQLNDRPFEVEFVTQMIPHHEGAIAMAKEAQAKAQDGRIKTLAAVIIAEQEKEIAQMRLWKAAWGK